MGKQAEAQYICANCEYDFCGFPAGVRPGDRRPLCRRCAGKGVDEGTDPSPVAGGRKSDGLIWIVYMIVAIITLSVAVASMILLRNRH